MKLSILLSIICRVAGLVRGSFEMLTLMMVSIFQEAVGGPQLWATA